ncbi:MAG: phosphate acyltransferase PlsX [Ignavibacteriales bacterium]|nr:phosphate acyltransferase PlsX [Ignavibacteriales bacterium]
MNSSIQHNKCRIAVDAMGGDFAPLNNILGANNALKLNSSIEISLIGKEKDIIDSSKKGNIDLQKFSLINAEEVIEMSDIPTEAIKSKKKSSIIIGLNLIKDNKIDALISAGNTGAMFTASTLILGRISGVGRPTIGAPIPTKTGGICTLIDSGTSVDCRPNHLVEYAILGTIFVREMYGINNPAVGLLNVGEEDTKGNELTIAANKLLKKSGLNFVGNVEGRDILAGTIDIVICDGFVGNVILKFAESIADWLKTKIKSYMDGSFTNKIRTLIAKGIFKNLFSPFDYQRQGGVPLLGVNGISIIGHGKSSPLAVQNMIFNASEIYRKNLINKFKEAIINYGNK